MGGDNFHRQETEQSDLFRDDSEASDGDLERNLDQTVAAGELDQILEVKEDEDPG